MISTKSVLSLAMAALTSVSCWAWGQKGHDVVAYIAENHLTATTKASVEKALDGKSIVYYANWLDDASNNIDQYKYTKTWHYRNVDAGQTFDSMPLNEKGDVVRALNEAVAKLRSGKLSQADEAFYLKLLVHLVGDMHQPLHMGHLSDLGGNLWKVKFFGRDTNLHSIWDTNLVEGVHKWSYTEWQQQIDRVPANEQDSIVKGSIEDWAKESLAIATQVYANTPEGTNVSYDYQLKARPIIEQQLEKGGLRLASLLNRIYDAKRK